MGLTVDEARSILLDQPAAVEGEHHGHPDFRVGKSIFATLWPTQDRSVLRLPEAFAENLEQKNALNYRIVSRSGGQGWVSIDLPSMDADEYRGLAEVAHQHLIAGKR